MHVNLHYNIRVSGKVQGVWFRKYTKQAAQTYRIKGFVENSADSSVYVEAEGGKNELELFIEWLHEGSPMSRVEEVHVEEAHLSGFSSFEIKR